MCRAGARSMVRFAQQEGIAHRVCGKLVVATDARTNWPGCDALYERGMANGLPVRRLSAARGRASTSRTSPRVAALHVASTGIIDYGEVCAALVAGCGAAGADLRLGAEVLGAARSGGRTWCAAPRPATSPSTWWSTAPACRATGWPGWPGARPGARGSCRSAASTTSCARSAAHLVRGPDLPGARPALPVPRRAPHPEHPRLACTPAPTPCSPAPARATAGATSSRATWPDAGLPGHLAAGPAALARRLGGGGPLAVAATCSPRACAGWCPSCATGDLVPARRRRAGPGADTATARWSTTSSSSATGTRCTCSTRRRRPPPARWRSPGTSCRCWTEAVVRRRGRLGVAPGGPSQITGGRPSRVIRSTVDHDIGRRGPGSLRHPSTKPRPHTSSDARSCTRATVSAVHTPR